MKKTLASLLNRRCPPFSWRSPFWQVVILLMMAAAGLAGMVVAVVIHQGQPERTKTQIVSVTSGMGAYEVGQLLAERGIIFSPLLFKLEARLTGVDERIRVGSYKISADMSTRQILAVLSAVPDQEPRITVPEGFTVDKIAGLLTDKGLDGEKFKILAGEFRPHGYMLTEQPVRYPCEGFLFPDTYDLDIVTPEKSLLLAMDARFGSKAATMLREKGLTDDGIRAIVTMASLIEREARLPAERKIIASVFYNRLAAGMPLQSCASVQYIIGYEKEVLSLEDTMTPSPYNTYLHLGLPPGPICNPGEASIEAALFPENTDYLYFVADNRGGHHFSKTYDEHLRYINENGQN
ncbi:MAG: endolytic transglycosylase MltG [Negativicutes bacterium]|nr:endolytic transglycosylase MltG [Negativicutes bacterium]